MVTGHDIISGQLASKTLLGDTDMASSSSKEILKKIASSKDKNELAEENKRGR